MKFNLFKDMNIYEVMSFGKINTLINKIINYINKKENKYFDLLQYNELKNKIYEIFNEDFLILDINSEMQNKLLNEIFIRLFTISFKFNNILLFDNGINCFRDFDDIYDDVSVPDNYKKLDLQFNKLKNLPQPVQRSQEWYDYRYNRITASDTAAAIDMNPYEPVEGFILKKCDPNFPFVDNATVFHGRKYEPIATSIYEHIDNVKVVEFGALPSDIYPFLGASPDGICSKYTLDNKFSSKLGTMLEIKCPVTREIIINGKIAGNICPFYYYCQVQQQLVCCELDICDFWQCKFTEYSSKKEYLDDNCSSCISTETINSDLIQNSYSDKNNYKKIIINDQLKKGIFLEFYPKNFKAEFDGDNIEWKSKYIYPSRLDMNEHQKSEWILDILDNYKNTHPDIYNNYHFNKIIYWKLEKSHNVSIKRDDKFITSIIPILNDTWEKILYYRKNQNKLDELKLIHKKRIKYIKFNTNFIINNTYIIDNKLLFLDKNTEVFLPLNLNKLSKNTQLNNFKKNKNVKKKEKLNDNDSDYYDYGDCNCNFIDD